MIRKGDKNMESILEEMQEMAEKVKDAVLESENIYNFLFTQRDSAKSNTLKQLLNEEITGYVNLSEKMGKYMQLYLPMINEGLINSSTYVRSSLEVIKTIEDKQIALKMARSTQRTYSILQNFNDINISIMNMAMETYIKVIDRNFKDWGEFAKKLGGKIANSTLDAIPIVSEIKGLCENVADIAELVNEYEDNAKEYSEIDKRLLEIEEHILAFRLSNLLIEDSIKILEEGQQGTI